MKDNFVHISAESTSVDCTVVVPTHRGEHRLPELLDAFAHQNYPGAWEVLVVVDGRLDKSEQVLAQYADRVPLRVIVFEEPQGVTRAMNTGFAESHGRIVVRCDDDLTPTTDFIATHMSHHANGPTGVVGPTRDVFANSAYARAYGRPANERSLRAAYARGSEQNWLGWAANNSAPRTAIVKAEGFDPAFVYGQDSELGYRLHKQGLPIVVDQRLEVPHRGPSTSAGTRIPRAFVSGASKRLFYLKHPETLPRRVAPESVAARVWQLMVRVLAATVTSREGFARVGRGVDVLLRILPVGVAGRVVALCVESAGRSGLRHGANDLSTYKKQKSSELRRELANRDR